jgi:transposase
MRKRASKIGKFVKSLSNTIKKARIPYFSCKKSPKKYTQHQHIILLGLKKYLKTDYRTITDLLREMPEIREQIDLKKIPHFTTLQKFFTRIGDLAITKLLLSISNPSIVAVDGTGFSSKYASSYYYQRLGKKVKRVKYQKLFAAVNVRRQVVVNAVTRECPGYKYHYMIPLIKKIKPRAVLADKGYDCTKNMEYLLDRKIKPVIFVRKSAKHGVRKKLSDKFDYKVYGKRAIVECVFSAMKRKFGDCLRSVREDLRGREVLLNCVVYNAYRISWLFGCFLQR